MANDEDHQTSFHAMTHTQAQSITADVNAHMAEGMTLTDAMKAVVSERVHPLDVREALDFAHEVSQCGERGELMFPGSD